jgi:hydroxymethylpyrimidine pyrophosphatase-like HAD family hydrolase
MGNAVASVKAAATTVTASNNDDGVARALEMILSPEAP